ncbi:hypothetical protein V3589_02625 [Sinorhizobium fredii]|uniref:hypothetical protein n=1 Tax=Rhizobium fredii TaxID=380 RepID=UPI0030A75D5C
MSVFAALLVAAAPASAKVEPAKPETRIVPDRHSPPVEPDMPCLRPPPSGAVAPRQVIVWTIRAADGTVLAIGATEVVRQRC